MEEQVIVFKMSDKPDIVKVADELIMINPYIRFVWSHEKNGWICDWNFIQKLSIPQLTNLMIQLELHSSRMMDMVKYEIDKENEKRGSSYEKFDE